MENYIPAKFCGNRHSGSRDLARPIGQRVMRFLQMGVPPWKTPTCQVWWPWTLWKWRYKYSCKYGYFTAKVTAAILKKRL